jgi:hypothetical protein
MDARSNAVWRGLHLYLGRAFSGYHLEPDGQYEKMYRICRPDGSRSDIANLSRAKDAAASMVDRDLRPGGRLYGRA